MFREVLRAVLMVNFIVFALRASTMMTAEKGVVDVSAQRHKLTMGCYKFPHPRELNLNNESSFKS